MTRIGREGAVDVLPMPSPAPDVGLFGRAASIGVTDKTSKVCPLVGCGLGGKGLESPWGNGGDPARSPPGKMGGGNGTGDPDKSLRPSAWPAAGCGVGDMDLDLGVADGTARSGAVCERRCAGRCGGLRLSGEGATRLRKWDGNTAATACA